MRHAPVCVRLAAEMMVVCMAGGKKIKDTKGMAMEGRANLFLFRWPCESWQSEWVLPGRKNATRREDTGWSENESFV